MDIDHEVGLLVKCMQRIGKAGDDGKIQTTFGEIFKDEVCHIKRACVCVCVCAIEVFFLLFHSLTVRSPSFYVAFHTNKPKKKRFLSNSSSLLLAR